MNIDKKLLVDIFTIPSLSGEEIKMAEFIKKKLDEMKVPYEEDVKGNIFSLRGAKPFLNAHMDTVQDMNDYYLAKFVSIKENAIIDGLGVIGGDDKCGIYIILRMLEKGYDINFAFTVSEEVGTVGSSFLVKTRRKDLKKCLYGITLDRKGNSDIICHDNGYGTIEFENALELVGKEFGYKPEMGVLSDADEFNECMSCANLSVGYYRAHTKKEFVILNDLINAEKFAEKIITTIDKSFKIPERRYNYKKYNKYGYGYYNGWGGDSYYDDYNYDRYYDVETKEWKDRKDEPTPPLEWDEDIDNYYDNLENKFHNKNKCALCGEKNDITYVHSLDDYYCTGCILEISEELFGIVETGIL